MRVSRASEPTCTTMSQRQRHQRVCRDVCVFGSGCADELLGGSRPVYSGCCAALSANAALSYYGMQWRGEVAAANELAPIGVSESIY